MNIYRLCYIMENMDKDLLEDSERSIRNAFQMLRERMIVNFQHIQGFDTKHEIGSVGAYLADMEQHLLTDYVYKAKRKLASTPLKTGNDD